jgi:hypothetical protein
VPPFTNEEVKPPLDYNNVNLINKPDIHVNVLVSDTNFATIALALANNAVRTAHTGDFVTSPEILTKSPAVAVLTASLAKARVTVEKSVAETITGI